MTVTIPTNINRRRVDEIDFLQYLASDNEFHTFAMQVVGGVIKKLQVQIGGLRYRVIFDKEIVYEGYHEASAVHAYNAIFCKKENH